MRAAAQFHRIGLARLFSIQRRAHGDHAHLVAVFFAKQRHGPGFDRIVDGHQPRFDRRVLQHDGIGHALDLGDLRFAHRLGVRIIEPQPVGRNQRALLRNMAAQHFAQRLVQKVGRRMVGADRRSAGMVDLERQRLVDLDRPGFDLDAMGEHAARLLCGIEHDHLRAVLALHRAGVSHLPAAFAVEWRLVEDDETLVSRIERIYACPVLDQRLDCAVAVFGLIAQKFCGPGRVGNRKPHRARCRITRSRPVLACFGFLARHGRIEPGLVDRNTPQPQRILGQIEREAISVVELEGGLAGQRIALAQSGAFVLENLQPAAERL